MLATATLLAACGGAPRPPVAPDLPTPVQRTAQPAEAAPANSELFTKLDNGLLVSITRCAPGAEAQLQLGVFAGSMFVAPGLAEIAAKMLTESSDVSQGRPSLEQAISRLGGGLQIEIGPLTTWINLRVPANRWHEAQTALRTALAAPALSRNQIERIRDELVNARCMAIRQAPLQAMARALLLGEPGTAAYITSLLDRDPSEVSLFLARMYRPDRAVVAMRVPEPPTEVLASLGRGDLNLASWSPPAASGGQAPLLERGFQAGIYWAPDETVGSCRVAIVSFLPDLTRPDAAGLLVVHACLTLDGSGGRLEQMLRTRGLGHLRWRSELVQTADALAVVLTTTASPADAAESWRALQDARQSLRDVPPNRSELELARRRASLTARLGEGDATSRLRLHTSLALRGSTPDALERRIAALQPPAVFNLPVAVETYLQQVPAAMVAIGGQVPASLMDVRRFEVLPPALTLQSTASNATTQAAAATPWLDQAAEVAGGAALLRRFDGFEAKTRVSTDRAPAVTDQLSWHIDGTLQRTREVLGAKIETKLRGDSWSEELDSDKQALNSHEAGLLQREMERHPLALLAAHVRGDLDFRPIAQRNVGDRDLMVLEALGTRFDRLRVHIDTISHLVRVVEVWETMPEGTVVHLEDAWSDYRSTGGLRAPFRRITTQNDGQNRIETLFSRWAPLLTRN
ncbi:MAG: hypothetical protein ABIP94_19940 [Planctomycetota bacterium]